MVTTAAATTAAATAATATATAVTATAAALAVMAEGNSSEPDLRKFPANEWLLVLNSADEPSHYKHLREEDYEVPWASWG